MSDAERTPLEALRRLAMVVKLVAEAADLDPEECVVRVKASGPEGSRVLVSFSLAECLAEADALTGEEA